MKSINYIQVMNDIKSIIGPNNQRMISLYSTLLGLASSQKHLEALHKKLPNNMRLLREDFAKLRKLWANLARSNAGTRNQKKLDPNSGLALLLLNVEYRIERVETFEGFQRLYERVQGELTDVDDLFVISDTGLIGYYVNKLHQNRGKDSDSIFYTDGNHIIHSNETSPGHGSDHFTIEFSASEYEMPLSLIYNKKEDKLYFKLIVWSYFLHEELTHFLLSNFMDTKCDSCVSSTAHGDKIQFIKAMPMGELMDDINQEEGEMFATAEFLKKLKALISQSYNLEIESIKGTEYPKPE